MTSETNQRRPSEHRPRGRLSELRRRPSRGARRPSELGRRPSTQAISSRCSSTSDAPKVGQGSGLYPRSSTLVHDTSRPTGPSGPPLHQIMTTGTPLDSVVIRLRSRTDNHLERVTSSKGTALTVGQRALHTVKIKRCPANCNSWTTTKRFQEDEPATASPNADGSANPDRFSLPQTSPISTYSSLQSSPTLSMLCTLCQ